MVPMLGRCCTALSSASWRRTEPNNRPAELEEGIADARREAKETLDSASPQANLPESYLRGPLLLAVMSQAPESHSTKEAAAKSTLQLQTLMEAGPMREEYLASCRDLKAAIASLESALIAHAGKEDGIKGQLFPRTVERLEAELEQAQNLEQQVNI
eukprot:2834378-Pleurochrysis_carterae.AAC.1